MAVGDELKQSTTWQNRDWDGTLCGSTMGVGRGTRAKEHSFVEEQKKVCQTE